MTVVKICGIRTVEDGLAAIDAGADMLGFNFYAASPRYLTPEACADLVTQLRAGRPACPLLVGVFVDETPATMQGILARCRLDYAQLSGDEPPEALDALAGRGFKAIRPSTLAGALAQAAAYTPATRPDALPALLLDASKAGHYGGSGARADWAVARALAETMPLMLAGGLTPDNVADAVHAAQPWGVDVASGVESAPGRKDPLLMKMFISRAKEAAAKTERVL